jgi:sulfur carrier protein
VTSIRLNGEPIDSAAATLADLVMYQGWQGKRIAIERNGAIVPKSLYALTEIKTDDTFEVVVAVGGG